MERRLGFDLHVLTARLDRAADRILRAEHHLSHRRFLALTLVDELGTATQRALAHELGVTEAAVSRMVSALIGDGLLESAHRSGEGNRRRLRLTATGRHIVEASGRLLEDRLAALAREGGVCYDTYAEDTRRLAASLDRVEQGRSP